MVCSPSAILPEPCLLQGGDPLFSCMTESQHSPVHGCGTEQSSHNPGWHQTVGQRAKIPLLLAGHLPAAYKELQLITAVCP